MAELYPTLRQIHALISQLGLIIGMVMLLIGIYIGLIRHGDVTRWYRRGVYAMTGMMLLGALIGLVMFSAGGRPYQDVHWIYGMGAVLALPFFIFVETTAKKRPAMGSYLWGFALMTAIILRTMSTGAAG